MENYENLGKIGEGTYGVVLKCRHKDTNALVAIKKFKESDKDEQVRKTAMREARILKQMRHENIVSLLEVFRRKGKLYLVFEYVERTILEDLEANPAGLPEVDTRKILFQLLKSIQYCHDHGVVHRDIKPENLLISTHGVLKLCDFGFARTLAAPGALLSDYVATRWYRAPELLVGDQAYGKGVDIWAIGCMLVEIRTGAPIFPGESDLDQLWLIVKCIGGLCDRHMRCVRNNPVLDKSMRWPQPHELEPLESRFGHFHPHGLELLRLCLQLDPEMRPSCSELLELPYFAGVQDTFSADFREHLERESREAAAFVPKRRRLKKGPNGALAEGQPPPVPPPAHLGASSGGRDFGASYRQVADAVFQTESGGETRVGVGSRSGLRAGPQVEPLGGGLGVAKVPSSSSSSFGGGGLGAADHLPDLRSITPRQPKQVNFPSVLPTMEPCRDLDTRDLLRERLGQGAGGSWGGSLPGDEQRARLRSRGGDDDGRAQLRSRGGVGDDAARAQLRSRGGVGGEDLARAQLRSRGGGLDDARQQIRSRGGLDDARQHMRSRGGPAGEDMERVQLRSRGGRREPGPAMGLDGTGRDLPDMHGNLHTSQPMYGAPHSRAGPYPIAPQQQQFTVSPFSVMGDATGQRREFPDLDRGMMSGRVMVGGTGGVRMSRGVDRNSGTGGGGSVERERFGGSVPRRGEDSGWGSSSADGLVPPRTPTLDHFKPKGFGQSQRSRSPIWESGRPATRDSRPPTQDGSRGNGIGLGEERRTLHTSHGYRDVSPQSLYGVGPPPSTSGGMDVYAGSRLGSLAQNSWRPPQQPPGRRTLRPARK